MLYKANKGGTDASTTKSETQINRDLLLMEDLTLHLIFSGLDGLSLSIDTILPSIDLLLRHYNYYGSTLRVSLCNLTVKKFFYSCAKRVPKAFFSVATATLQPKTPSPTPPNLLKNKLAVRLPSFCRIEKGNLGQFHPLLKLVPSQARAKSRKESDCLTTPIKQECNTHTFQMPISPLTPHQSN